MIPYYFYYRAIIISFAIIISRRENLTAITNNMQLSINSLIFILFRHSAQYSASATFFVLIASPAKHFGISEQGYISHSHGKNQLICNVSRVQ